MKYLIFLVLLLGIVYSNAEFQQGTDAPFYFDIPCRHTFHCDTEIGRTKLYTVKFPYTFSSVPQVVITIQLFDAYQNPQSFQVKLGDVTAEQFQYSFTVLDADPVYTMYIQWTAFLDNNVKVKYYYDQPYADTTHMDFSDKPLECDNASGISYLLGYESSSVLELIKAFDNNVIDLTTIGSNNGFDISVSTVLGDLPGISQINTFSFVYVGVCNDKHSVAQKVVQNKIPIEDQGGVTFEDRVSIVQNEKLISGLTGWSTGTAANLRVHLKEVQFIDSQTVLFAIRHWADTVFNSASAGFVSLSVVNECAELFSECNYQGERYAICSGEPLNEIPASINVKSVTIPTGRTLTLYDQTNLEGGYTSIKNNVACFENGWVFT